ncbi:MAG: hypothetical protein HUJ26_23655 [Planctomycetaceae bacterium]|nr:hypothetical protein [Planctomycetaceae bacterium]
MRNRILFLLWILSCVVSQLSAQRPPAPRVESIVLDVSQPDEKHPDVIWYDNFDEESKQQRYAEQSGELTHSEQFGASGQSLEMFYGKGKRGVGGRKVFFGDSPTYPRQTVRRGESFDDIYWRIYVKHPHNWQGDGPAKLSRATSLVPPGWRQAMIAHVWSSGEALTLDPATGVRNGKVVTTRYNDFSNLKWLGNRPASQFKLHGDDGRGWWVCVEARAKLNTPGKKDGLQQLWIDGRLEAERRNLDWRGDFTERGINAVFLEAYWNDGSPVDQSRWIDEFVISTEPIGPVVCSTTPELIKTPYRGAGNLRAWQIEVSADAEGRDVVWKSGDLTAEQRVTIEADRGDFVGSHQGRTDLKSDQDYFSRVRQQSDEGEWSDWSPWHQPFRTTNDNN